MVEEPVHEEDAATQSTVAALLDAVVRADRMINALAATRAGLIEALRVASVEPDPDPEPSASARTAEMLELRQEMDLRSMTAELACALHLPQSSAARLVDDSQALATLLPATAAALAAGTITYRHATTMIALVAGLDPHLRARAEATLVPRATVLTVAALTRAATRERDRLDPVPLVDRHTRAAAGRTVLLEPDIDGMAWLHAHLPATQATAIFHRVSDAAAALQHPDDPRTLPQLRADALAALSLDDDARDALDHALGDLGDLNGLADAVAGAAAHPLDDPLGAGTGESTSRRDAGGRGTGGRGTGGWDDAIDAAEARTRRRRRDSARLMRQTLRGIRPTVAVTVPVLTLLSGDAPGDLEGYGPIDAETARQLCADAPSFLRILTHPHTGAILGVDRNRYTVPADLKAWLRLRDATCRFPGCARRATRCDLDHVTDWAHGGTTDQTNLIHLCRTHHRLRHTTRWKAQLTTAPLATAPLAATPRAASPPDGPRSASVRWTAPSGRTYTTTDALTGRATTSDPPISSVEPEPPSGFPDIPPF
ncbi:HNH endonuclease signature motif containing protein [Sanguibacter suarezii]|uniref:HNH endonuclease signature motif containing protein n=1 Tax=Sanguibacter suarezii TaxID=60921 RepID=UPI00082A924D|nr:HNH endonuclease signature motif containing protein [Sanguibacter suarezii]